MNIEERKLADVLHRVTPEPARPVTVEQVAYRLVSEPRLGRQTRGREPRPRRGGLALSRAFAPVMAAAAVIVIAGASAGLAVLANSHHNPPPVAVGGPSSSSVASASASSSPSRTSSSAEQITPGTTIAGGPWGAQLINHQTFIQGSLVSGDGSLYAYGNGTLDRIDPTTGTVTATTPYNPPVANPPVIVGSTVWVVWSYSGANVVLHAYDAQTLAPVRSVQVPAAVAQAGIAGGVLASGSYGQLSHGQLYVAAGVTVAVVNADNGRVIRRIDVAPAPGLADSVAVSPDGRTLYVAVGWSPYFKVLVYNLSTDRVVAVSSLQDGGTVGNLVATSGGVWGTAGSGMSEWTWFARSGDLGHAVRIGQGAGAGFDSVPNYNGGVVWVGGSHTLTCASPASGRILASVTLPTDQGVVEYFGDPAVVGDHAYSIYQDNAAQRSGLVRMAPPAACSANISS